MPRLTASGTKDIGPAAPPPKERVSIATRLSGYWYRLSRDPLSRNSLFIVATTLVNSALGYVFWVVGARLFPASAVGIVAATISAGSVVGILAYAGVGMTLIHSLPQVRKDREWSDTLLAGTGTAALIGLGGAMIVVAALPLLSAKFALLHQFPNAAIFVLGTGAWSLGSALDYAFIAERSAHLMLVRNTIHAAAKLLVAGLLVWVAVKTPTFLLLAWSAAAVIGGLVGAALLWKWLGRGRLSRPRWADLVARANFLRRRLWGHQVVSISGQLPPLLLPVLVTARISARADAFFYLTWLVTGVLLVVSAAVADALFTEGAYQPAELRSRAWFALKLVMAVAIPLMVAFLVGGGLILSVFGPAYAAHALLLLRLLALAAVPDAITNLYVALLRVRSRFLAAGALNLGMGAGTLVASWFLLPVFGITGAGVAWIGMQICGSLYCGVDLLHRRVRATPLAVAGTGAKR